MDGLESMSANLTPIQTPIWGAVFIFISAVVVMLLASFVMHLANSRALRGFRNSAGRVRGGADGEDSDQAETTERYAHGAAKGLSEHGALLTAPRVSVARNQNTLFEAASGSEQALKAHAGNRQRILSLWQTLRALVERSAADRRIDGAKAAEYAHMDRRDYLPLIESLHADGNLSGDLTSWRRAYELSRLVLSGRAAISAAAVQEMEEVCDALSRSAECETDFLHPGNVIMLRSKLPKSHELWKTNAMAAKSLKEDPYCIPAGTILSGKASTTDID